MNQNKRIKLFRNILQRYEAGQILDNDDFKLIIDLFKNHPNWETKKGKGIKEIKVVLDRWKKKAFVLLRIDNTTTDISFIIAARGRRESKIKRIKNACRYHIIPEILKFKDTIDFNSYFCPITGKKLEKRNCHIDHYNLTFNELVNLWLKNKDINFLVNKLNDNTKDNVVYDMFEDEEIIKEFIEFHNKNTHLRAVLPNANLSLLKKNDTPTTPEG